MRHLVRLTRHLTAIPFLSAEGQTRQVHLLTRLVAAGGQKYQISYRTKIWRSSWPSIGPIDNCIYAQLTDSFKKHGDQGKIAMISCENPNHRYLYTDLLREIRSLEGFLHELGFEEGDIATTVLENCIEFPVIMVATIGRGGAFSGASSQFNAEEIARQLNDNNSRVVFTSKKNLSKVVEAAKHVPSLKKIVCIREPGSSTPLPSYTNVVDWSDAISTKTIAPRPQYNLNDIAVLPYSSGTTGVPKGVALSHINFMTAVLGYKNHSTNVIRPKVKEHMGDFDDNGNLIMYLPFYHVYGKVTLTAALLRGDTAIVINKMNPTLLYDSVEKYKPWCLYMVPPIALMLVKDPNVKKYDFSSVKFAVSGAAPLGKELAEEFQKKFPNIFLTQGYGMSETALCSFFHSCENYGQIEHVGTVAPEFEAKVVDIVTGKELDVNQSGELCLRGQAVMIGYLNRPEETAKVIDEEGWFHTGDVGFFNEKGEMYIVDRIKELIKVKGLQVAPAELESILAGCPKIKDVAVIGVPHKEFGEVPRAYVVKRDPQLTVDEVKEIIEDRLAKYKRLEGGVFFVEEIPKSPSGKILRRELKHMAI